MKSSLFRMFFIVYVSTIKLFFFHFCICFDYATFNSESLFDINQKLIFLFNSTFTHHFCKFIIELLQSLYYFCLSLFLCDTKYDVNFSIL